MTQPNEDTGYINALRAEVDHVSKKVKEMHRDVFEKHFADTCLSVQPKICPHHHVRSLGGDVRNCPDCIEYTTKFMTVAGTVGTLLYELQKHNGMSQDDAKQLATIFLGYTHGQNNLILNDEVPAELVRINQGNIKNWPEWVNALTVKEYAHFTVELDRKPTEKRVNEVLDFLEGLEDAVTTLRADARADAAREKAWEEFLEHRKVGGGAKPTRATLHYLKKAVDGIDKEIADEMSGMDM